MRGARRRPYLRLLSQGMIIYTSEQFTLRDRRARKAGSPFLAFLSCPLDAHSGQACESRACVGRRRDARDGNEMDTRPREGWRGEESLSLHAWNARYPKEDGKEEEKEDETAINLPLSPYLQDPSSS